MAASTPWTAPAGLAFLILVGLFTFQPFQRRPSMPHIHRFTRRSSSSINILTVVLVAFLLIGADAKGGTHKPAKRVADAAADYERDPQRQALAPVNPNANNAAAAPTQLLPLQTVHHLLPMLLLRPFRLLLLLNLTFLPLKLESSVV
ncbi:hypothetical protein Agub_g9166 [Astrephomene gubernaculifera]|uniref:Uncharacterized protein n=1 Tax=Astrephomene gubernaculifera TaxID=47775 RepID=A0AAD3DT63_9CHLO|nr:hypothetical protein Agub_g9166 [Astrephomene gubernaculifera]